MKKSLIFSFSLIGQIGFATATPLVLFGIAGRYFDKKLGTAPWLFLFGLALATIQIFFYIKSIIKRANESFKEL